MSNFDKIWTTTKCIILFFVSVCWLNSCSPEENNQTLEKGSNEIISFYDYSVYELEILDLVNSHRTSTGLKELQTLDQISVQASHHNAHMILAREVCHHNFGKRYRLLIEKVGARYMGENIGHGYASAGTLVKAWIKSEDHRKIMEGSSSHFGVSAREGEDLKIYVTLIFIR